MGMALFGGLTTPETPRSDRNVGKAQDAVIKAAVLDEDGNELPDGQVGLLAVITPSRTPGYWKNARLTSSFELNGFWLTGDVARRDAEGNFYHLDRTVDVIDTVDGPVYSLEIEEVLIADCADVVLDCAVVGGAGGAGQPPGRGRAVAGRRRPRDTGGHPGEGEQGTRHRRACPRSRRSSSPVPPRTTRSARPARCSSASCAPGTPPCSPPAGQAA
jgi:acyl-CoA synthetase (AMP-forming)/AMP-acid ligase II